MKSQFTSLFFVLCFILSSLFVAAQHQPLLKDVNDVLLPQLIKQKKEIHFVAVKEAHGTVIKWYEEPKHTAQTMAVMPTITDAAAANFHLTKDINAQTDANPVNSDFIFNTPYAVINQVMYFSASDGIHGAELWRSDGTAAGTYLVKDILPGSASSSPTEIITAGNKICFVTQNSLLNNYQLWTSDGTESGTVLLHDFQRQGPGVNGSYLLTYTGNAVYFIASSLFTFGTELWKTTGTSATTVLVKDFGSSEIFPLEHAAAQGLFYFTTYNDTTGRELWRSDGTDAGTFLVKDIYPGNDFYNSPEQLTAYNSKLYFSADDGSGRKLWLTDGSTAGTNLANGNKNVTITDDGSYVFTNESFAIQDGELYMLAAAPATGSELYKYNAAAGFLLVKDITSGTAGGYIHNITPALGRVAFEYQDTLTKQVELWRTDGTAANTSLIKSYNQGSTSFNDLTPGNSVLYFSIRDSSTGYELWKTDGTSAGTALVKDIYAGVTSSKPQDLTYLNGVLYFGAASKKAGIELWKSTGDAANTRMITEINTTSTSYSGSNYYSGYIAGNEPGGSIGNTLYFSATKPETGYELYKSDGTNSGTLLAKDITAGENGSFPSQFLAKHNAVYFAANSTDSAGQPGYYLNLFRTDSAGITTAVATPPVGFITSYDVADNGWIYYILYNFTSGTYELWRSDGTAGGNILLTNKIANSVNDHTVKTIGNTAYFTAADEDGIELWKTNGSVAGTKKVKDIYTGSSGSNPYSLIVYKNNLYFGADDGSGVALWRSNGTAVGTIKIKAIVPYGLNYTGFSYTNYFCIVNDVLYMNAFADATGTELWRTNGTPGGTVLVKDLTGNSSNADPSFLTNVNGTLFFNALYNQLWKSNGTSSGTSLIKTISTSDYILFRERCVADGKFFFNTDQLLWVSDGTDAGTHLVADNGLNGVTEVTNLATAGNTVFFNGYTDLYSYELYAGDAAKVMPSLLASSRTAEAKPSSFSATVLQNPIAGMLRMNVVSDKNQTINVSVSNANGNIAAQQKATLYKGSNNVMINAGNWQTGMYLVKLYNGAGESASVSVFK